MRYIVVAFIFSVLIRFWYPFVVWENDIYPYGQHLLINTEDGYYFAQGAKELLRGEFAPQGMSQLSALLGLVFSLEGLMFYMSGILGSLIVVPLVLIGRQLGDERAGFLGALIACSVAGYFNRTGFGYFDTDMLNLFFPLMLVWSLMAYMQTRDEKYILISALEIVFYRWWYPPSYSLEFAFFALVLVYVLIYRRKDEQFYRLLGLMLIAMLNLPDVVRLGAVLVGYFYIKNIRVLFLVGAGLFVFTGGLNPIWAQLKKYVFNDALLVDDLNLHFYTTMQTIEEAVILPVEENIQRLSGSLSLFIVSLCGYILMIVHHPKTAISLPIFGLGMLSFVGGVRFGMYAAPLLGLGLGYVISFLASEFQKWLKNEPNVKLMSRSLIVVVMVLILGLHLERIAKTLPATVMNYDKIELIKNAQIKKDDFIVAWWDHGYALRYYTDANVLIDGGRHNGAQNFMVSYGLFANQSKSAHIFGLDVEYSQKRTNETQERPQTNLSWMMQDNGFSDSHKFLNSLDTLHVKYENDIYLYLPYDILMLVPQILNFSNIDLMSGELGDELFYFYSRYALESDDGVIYEHGLRYKDKKLYYMDSSWDISKIIEISNDGVLKIDDFSNSGHSMLKFGTRVLVIEQQMLESTLMQLLVLTQPDERFYELVSSNSEGKIYKVKK